jgi:hypothetical protein
MELEDLETSCGGDCPLSVADVDIRILDAILKGIIEHGDSGYFFGSLGGHRFYLERCAEAGFITPEGDPTEKGRARYSQGHLGELPECRWYYWDAQKAKGVQS